MADLFTNINNMYKYQCIKHCNGGDAGIRTLGTREGSTVFETAPFDHSGTSPLLVSLAFELNGYKRN